LQTYRNNPSYFFDAPLLFKYSLLLSIIIFIYLFSKALHKTFVIIVFINNCFYPPISYRTSRSGMAGRHIKSKLACDFAGPVTDCSLGNPETYRRASLIPI
jgi:hypothetical protein